MTTDVVIGAASGMGAAVARRLATAERRLVLADVDTDGLGALTSELGGLCEAWRCDLTSPADLTTLARDIEQLGVLVMTAGLSPTMAGGRRIFEVDLLGPANLLRTFVPIVGEGSVGLLFSSMAGRMVPPVPAIDAVLDDPWSSSFFTDLASVGIDLDDSGFAYGLAKRGLIRLVAREAVGWGRRGARLLSLSPGIVDTPMGRQEAREQEVMAEMVSASPLGRMLRADEVAEVAAFLVSDAAAVMTGTDVLVDGGAVAAFASGS